MVGRRCGAAGHDWPRGSAAPPIVNYIVEVVGSDYFASSS